MLSINSILFIIVCHDTLVCAIYFCIKEVYLFCWSFVVLLRSGMHTDEYTCLAVYISPMTDVEPMHV